MKYYDKRFLSDRSDEGGSIRWTLDTENRFNTEIIITDCSNSVNLDISFYKNKHIDRRIEKLDNLINSLTKLRKCLLLCKKNKKEKK